MDLSWSSKIVIIYKGEELNKFSEDGLEMETSIFNIHHMFHLIQYNLIIKGHFVINNMKP
jgi:hypothetical protein